MTLPRLWKSLLPVTLLTASCAPSEGKGLALTQPGTGAQVRFDMYARPLPDIPLPNDFATRYDPSAPNKRRINASMVATTEWERSTRASIDDLDGWGTYQSITVGFEKPLDVHNVLRRHQGDDYDPRDDAAYLLDITRDSPDFCQFVPLDLGEGNFPLTLERPDYFPNDSHNDSDQLVFEDREEDVNRNGKLDLGEDLDMDGVLDHPNTLFPGDTKLNVLPFYERETNTLIMKPVMPLRESTTYAVVLTRRLLDEDGRPVRSPFDYVNHTQQTQALEPVLDCLPKYGLAREDVAFTWSYTTQSITREFKAVRDGLYGHGSLARLSTEFPAQIKQLYRLQTLPEGSTANAYIVTSERFRDAAIEVLKALEGRSTLTPQMLNVIDHHKFIDYHVIFSFTSPQFFPRVDAEKKPLPLYKQVMKIDPLTGDAFTRPEDVIVYVTIPKNRRGPAPAVILGHGYTGGKYDPLIYGGFFARVGLASIGMDNVSHGLGLDPVLLEVARGLLRGKNLEPMYKGLVQDDRAADQNADGIKDPGADFWTSYITHTRDVVRQTSIDYAQLVRILRGFNGVQTWNYDNNRDQKNDLAGDFDGDGVLDIGGTAPIHISGGSLGGIMSALMAGAEPQLDTSVPISGGAGLPDIGIRSTQGGVGEAVNLRMMGPLLITLKNTEGKMELWQYLPDLNKLGKAKLGVVTATLKEGDTAVVTNLRSGEHRCGRVMANQLLRVAVSSDEGDPLRLDVFDGALPPAPRDGCVVPKDTTPYWTFDKLGVEVKWYAGKADAGVVATTLDAGTELRALGDGFGLRRQTPEMRRFMGLAQLAIERGDPVNWVPYSDRWNLTYATGEKVETNLLIVNTVGDMKVPVATGAAVARAAGMIELRQRDPRWDKTPNRVLIDNGVVEAVERTGRFKSSRGVPTLVDVEHFSSVTGANDGFDVPRLNPPLRLVGPNPRLGGYSGVVFPMVKPEGTHGFDLPNPGATWNLGAFMVNLLGRFMQTSGRELKFDTCLPNSSCTWLPPIPAN